MDSSIIGCSTYLYDKIDKIDRLGSVTMNYGEIFRNLRAGKKRTLEEVAESTGNEISKSFISKFERNESDISFSRLRLLLKALNISLNEFSHLIETETSDKDDIDKFIEETSSYYYEESTNKLFEIMNEEKEKHNITGIDDHQYKALLAQSFYCDLKKEKLPEADSIIISNYLFGVDYWSKYELIILTNCIRSLSINVAITLTDELLAKDHLFGEFEENIEVKTVIVFNTIINCLENKMFVEVERYLYEIDKMNLDDRFLYQKVLLKIFKIIVSTTEINMDQSRSKIDSLKEFLVLVDANHLLGIVVEIVDEFFPYSGK